jgi:hypothetical protein
LGEKVKSSSWVHRKGRERGEKKEDMLVESVDKNCMLALI